MRIKEYFLNILIAVDQVANTVFGGCPDETLSAHAWRLSDRYWYANFARIVIDLVFRIFGQKEHCWSSYQSEKTRHHLPSEYQEEN